MAAKKFNVPKSAFVQSNSEADIWKTLKLLLQIIQV